MRVFCYSDLLRLLKAAGFDDIAVHGSSGFSAWNLVAAALELTHHSEKIACWRAPIKYGRAARPMEIATKALAA